MKKFVKGVLVLSIGVMLAGCSCNNNQDQTQVEFQESYNANNVYDDVSTNLTNLYDNAVKSTVVIEGIGQSSSQLGTGVVYKEEGNYAYIITNAHVLTDKNGNDFYSNIDVTFSNYVKVRGTFVYLDKNEDVAVITVAKSDNYVKANIVANDTTAKVGDSVFAIGNPHGNYFSVTEGIISKNKIKTTTDYISGTKDTKTYVYNTTATINSGNSGGPVFNSDGKVIAINTMQPTADNIRNFNLAIPVNYFIKVADYIVTNRSEYVKPTLNLEVKAICDYSVSEITTLGINVERGVYVTSSNETEVARGRIITHVNGAEVATLADYEYELLKYSKNEIVELTTSDITGNSVRKVNLKMK